MAKTVGGMPNVKNKYKKSTSSCYDDHQYQLNILMTMKFKNKAQNLM